LQEYVEEEGNANVPLVYEGHDNLGMWIHKQRQDYQKQKLKDGDVPEYLQKRFERLEKIGFHWDVLSAQWAHMYRQLEEYIEAKGNANSHRGTRAMTIWGIGVLHNEVPTRVIQ
jgi:hypothetical protein